MYWQGFFRSIVLGIGYACRADKILIGTTVVTIRILIGTTVVRIRILISTTVVGIASVRIASAISDTATFITIILYCHIKNFVHGLPSEGHTQGPVLTVQHNLMLNPACHELLRETLRNPAGPVLS